MISHPMLVGGGDSDVDRTDDDGTTLNTDEQTLSTTSLGTATGTDDSDSNLVDTGSSDPSITVVENDRQGHAVPAGTDDDSADGSSPGGGSGMVRALNRVRSGQQNSRSGQRSGQGQLPFGLDRRMVAVALAGLGGLAFLAGRGN